MESRKVIPAGIMIFYIWRNKFLLILRDDKPDINFPNTWSPVTGGVEEGENVMVCAERESREEIGFFPKDFKILGISSKGNGFFFGVLDDTEKKMIVLGEGQRFDFFEFEELSKIKIEGAFKKYLDKYPNIFMKIVKENYYPLGQDFGLATWK